MVEKKEMFLSFIIIFIIITFLSSLTECRGVSPRGIPLPEGEGKGIGGSIAFDGKYFWGMRIPLSFKGEGEKEIVKFDKKGNEIDAFIPEENFSEFAFDGENIWTADAFGYEATYSNFHGNFYIVDKETGERESQFTLYEDYNIDGLAASEDRLWTWVTVYDESGSWREIFEIDPVMGEIVNKIRLHEDISRTCSGIAYFDGYIWAVTGLIKKEVLKVAPESGFILKSYDFTGRVINGIVTDGKNIYLADGENDVLFIMKR